MKQSNKFTIKGQENLTLQPESSQMIEVWCKVWVDGVRTPERDGFFPKRLLTTKS